MANGAEFSAGRLLIVAFEGWNDAGDAASTAVSMLRDSLDVHPIAEVESEDYFDYQFNRPVTQRDEHGERTIVWPAVTMYGPDDRTRSGVHLLLGAEPSHNWKTFAGEIVEMIADAEITGMVMLGAMLADVPHTRPISVFATSESAELREEFDIERSRYEGPTGILSVLSDAAARAGVPSMMIWASVPHYVHNSPSPKATLALLDKLRTFTDIEVPRDDLVEEATAWEAGIDALAAEDDEMSAYIAQLERARDTVDAPEATGDAIAEEFERYLRRRDGRGGPGTAGGQAGPGGPSGPPAPPGGDQPPRRS